MDLTALVTQHTRHTTHVLAHISVRIGGALGQDAAEVAAADGTRSDPMGPRAAPPCNAVAYPETCWLAHAEPRTQYCVGERASGSFIVGGCAQVLT